MPRQRDVPVDPPPPSENYVDFGHQLRTVILPDITGPLVMVRTFCVNCGFRFQAEGILRVCAPIEPKGGK